MFKTWFLLTVGLLGLAAAGCSADGDAGDDQDVPTVVVTTDVLGDAVGQILGESAIVQVLIPTEADPHSFQLSARDVAELRDAAAIVVNGGDLEGPTIDAVGAAERDGVAVCTALDGVETIRAGHEHPHRDDEPAGDGDQPDPHFFSDPIRMAGAVEWLSDCLVAADFSLDPSVVSANTDAVVAELRLLDQEVTDILAAVPADSRLLAVNHDVLAYFADRYDFEVVGVVVPGGVTHGSPDAASMTELAAVLSDQQIPILFTDASAADDAARTVAAEAGGVEVVALHTESLGPSGSGSETYTEMIRSSARAIAAALG